MSKDRSWLDLLSRAISRGGKTIAPTGGEIRSIRFDGTMLEHPHADHPTYLGMVEAVYIGDPEHYAYGVDNNGVRHRIDDDELYVQTHETHALIYTDDSIALTLYECCYALWSLHTGELVSGSLWKRGEWKIDPRCGSEYYDSTAEDYTRCTHRIGHGTFHSDGNSEWCREDER